MPSLTKLAARGLTATGEVFGCRIVSLDNPTLVRVNFWSAESGNSWMVTSDHIDGDVGVPVNVQVTLIKRHWGWVVAKEDLPRIQDAAEAAAAAIRYDLAEAFQAYRLATGGVA